MLGNVGFRAYGIEGLRDSGCRFRGMFGFGLAMWDLGFGV